MVHPFEISSNKAVNDVFVQQLTKVKHLLSKHNGHAHFNAKFFLVVICHIIFWCVGQELEAALVEVLVVVLSLIIQAVDMSQTGIHLRIHIAEMLNLLSD